MKGGGQLNISYQFCPFPTAYLQYILSQDFTKNELRVLLCIAENIFSYPEKREEEFFCTRISVSYIAEYLGVQKIKVSLAIKSLAKKNHIIVKEDFSNKKARIIQLNINRSSEEDI